MGNTLKKTKKKLYTGWNKARERCFELGMYSLNNNFDVVVLYDLICMTKYPCNQRL